MPLLAKLKKAFIPPDDNAAFNAPPGVNRTHVWLEVSIGDQPAGKIELELFDDITPKTAENFRVLASNEHTNNGHPAGYRGSTFHRVVPGFMIQGGDFVQGNGTGMYSIYGRGFPDENFKMKHTIPGLLSMANSGPGTNGCQFFITTAPADFLDGKHVCFGRVVGGMDVVRAVEATPTGQNDRPVQTVRIVDSGVTGVGAGTGAAAAAGTAAAGTPGPQDELRATEGGAAGLDPATTATGTSAAPAAHNFEGTGAPVDTSGAPIAHERDEGHGGAVAAGTGALAAGAGAAGLAHHQQGRTGVPPAAGHTARGTTGNVASPTDDTFHDALEGPSSDAAQTRSPAAGGYSSGAALDSMRSRHDPLDPRSGKGTKYEDGAALDSAVSNTSAGGYGGGAGVSPTKSRGGGEENKPRLSAFASAAVDFASPTLRDNVGGQPSARSPDADTGFAGISRTVSGNTGGGIKGLYRRISRTHTHEDKDTLSGAPVGQGQAAPGNVATTANATGNTHVTGAAADFAAVHPVDGRHG